MSYDAFDNMIQRDTYSWRDYHTFTSQYQNNRNTQTTISEPPTGPQTSNWTYDADGQVTHDHNKEYTYDAAGNKTLVFETTEVAVSLTKKLWLYQDYDADGVRAKRIEQEQYNAGAFTFKTSYYLRSSVLNGKVITELNEFGQRRENNVYANGSVLVQQKDNQVRWVHQDPVTGSHRESFVNGSAGAHSEFDSLGNDAPLVDPDPPEQTPDYEYVGNYGNNGNPYDGPSGCMIDGQQVPCSVMMQVLRFGTGVGRDGGSIQFLARDVSWRTWSDGPAFGVGVIRIPRDQVTDPAQNTDRRLTTDETSALRNRIADLLSDPNCLPFIQELLSKTAEQNPENPNFSNDPLKLFDAIDSRGGYNYSTRYGINTKED